jgi:hypothetical protein
MACKAPLITGADVHARLRWGAGGGKIAVSASKEPVWAEPVQLGAGVCVCVCVCICIFTVCVCLCVCDYVCVFVCARERERERERE